MSNNLTFYLKVSRPGLWFQTLWVYLLPVVGTQSIYTWPFWIGFIYATFPLNFMIYGWNDMVDYETDRHNPRKNSFLWGAKGTKEQLQGLMTPIIIAQLPFIIFFIWYCGWPMAVVLFCIYLVNITYNLPKYGLRGVPPLELVNILGMLIIVPLCTYLNDFPSLPWQSMVYLGIFCILAQLIGEIMDIEPDRKAGRRTTATVIGNDATKLLVIALVVAEAVILYAVFHAYMLAAYMIFVILWLIFDFVYLNKKMPYSIAQYNLLGFGINAAGYGSILWVWYTQALHQIY
ncbi:UbiA family prenyltransferase [Candidatus Uabimicrobium amorphum]|uniref:Prenyltransferase n=1 Tax=Uabimicrobium amorphum TaxID=2596890 RepID=A0A5S9F1S9_UABAM|nr:UbiA family prenyltransferase [Candidatus Uabimicrobium amorphum]BBM81729.1 prenyltransferase [Candidatus Uabimicrobium amorphum]